MVKIYKKKKSLACKGGVARCVNEHGGGTFMGNMIIGPGQRRQDFFVFLCVSCGSPLSFLKMSTTIVLPYPFFPFSGFSFSRFFSLPLSFPQPRLQ